MASDYNSSLATNLVGSLILVLALNALIFGLGWDMRSETPNDVPGWIVGSVWIVLFALMGLARWHLAKLNDHPNGRGVFIVTALMILCAAFPFYALQTGSRIAGLAGNIGTIIATGFAVTAIWPLSRKAAFFLFPVIPWLLFATWGTARGQGWL